MPVNSFDLNLTTYGDYYGKSYFVSEVLGIGHFWAPQLIMYRHDTLAARPSYFVPV